MHEGSMVWGGWPQAPGPKEEHRIKTHISFTLSTFWASQVALVIKNPPATAGDTRDQVLSLGGEDPLRKGMATHPSILAWRIP